MPEARRLTPRLLSASLSARALFIAGAATIPAFLLQPSLILRAMQVVLFAVLAALNGKRIKYGYFLVIVASITAFNLLTPLGRILVEVGPFQITAGALMEGVTKGLTISGLVFLSLASIRPDLRLPGRFGGLLAKVFYYFQRILEGKRRIRVSRLVSSLDDILGDLYEPGQSALLDEASLVTNHRSAVLGALVFVATQYAALFAGARLPM